MKGGGAKVVERLAADLRNVGAFKPEHVGQLSLYLSAVEAQVTTEHDGPTIGMPLCKNKSRLAA